MSADRFGDTWKADDRRGRRAAEGHGVQRAGRGDIGGGIGGLLVGWALGKTAEYYTSDGYSPVKKIAQQSETGPATTILGGISTGMVSVAASVALILIGVGVAYWCGTIAVAEDAFGVVLAVFLLALVAIIAISRWAHRRQDRTGQQFPVFTVGIGLLLAVIAFLLAAILHRRWTDLAARLGAAATALALTLAAGAASGGETHVVRIVTDYKTGRPP